MRKRLVLNRGPDKLPGFARDEFEPGKAYTADKPHRLAILWEICVHLADISGRPSTLLRSIPVESEKCGGRRMGRKEDRLYAFQLSEGMYKGKEVTLKGVGS